MRQDLPNISYYFFEMNWIDAHCHLSDPRLNQTLAKVITESLQKNITQWIQGGIDPADWSRQLKLKEDFPGILPVFGLHPWRVVTLTRESCETSLKTLEEYIDRYRPIALGELGVDLHPKHAGSETKDLQRYVFASQLQLAQKSKLPIVIHCVSAHDLVLEELGGFYPHGGLVHSFSGSYEVAKKYLDRNICFSLCGSALRSKLLWLGEIPKELWVVETDAPDQTPHTLPKGSLNHPQNLIEIAAGIGATIGVSSEDILDQSTKNLKRIFSL